MYRMPTHFGPSTGPRQGPDGRRFDGRDSPKSTSLSVSFRSDPEQLEALLPGCFELGDEPIVTVYATEMKEIEWLAGRGYSVLGVSFPAKFNGKEDKVEGSFLAVLWENLCDPIITGREELGFSKIYCEISEPRISPTGASVSASWLGFPFLDLEVTDLGEPSACDFAVPVGDGTLHYKYLPRTGKWGVADVEYPVLTPATGSNLRVIERLTGKGKLTWNRARWEDLPTFYSVVNGLTDLEVVEYLGASLTRSIGGKDLSDQRILR